MSRSASETDEATKVKTSHSREESNGVRKQEWTDAQLENATHPVVQPGETRVENAAEAAQSRPEEHHVKQQLSPLTSQDEVDLSESPGLELEVNAIPPLLRKAISYQTPKIHRRRPGNSFNLATRNFVAEFKVRFSAVYALLKGRCTLCVPCRSRWFSFAEQHPPTPCALCQQEAIAH